MFKSAEQVTARSYRRPTYGILTVAATDADSYISSCRLHGRSLSNDGFAVRNISNRRLYAGDVAFAASRERVDPVIGSECRC